MSSLLSEVSGIAGQAVAAGSSYVGNWISGSLFSASSSSDSKSDPLLRGRPFLSKRTHFAKAIKGLTPLLPPLPEEVTRGREHEESEEERRRTLWNPEPTEDQVCYQLSPLADCVESFLQECRKGQHWVANRYLTQIEKTVKEMVEDARGDVDRMEQLVDYEKDSEGLLFHLCESELHNSMLDKTIV